MSKKFISLLCAFLMLFTSAQPIFANDTLYNEFKNAGLKEIKSKFLENFEQFGLTGEYNESEKSMIILEAWNQGFSSFNDLKAKVQKAASDYSNVKNGIKNKTFTDEYKNGYSNEVTMPAFPNVTDADDMFKVGGKEFILLDYNESTKMFLVMAKDTFGSVSIVVSENKGDWNNENSNLLSWKLTNRLAFNNYSTNTSLPEEIIKHIDIFHAWDVEKHAEKGASAIIQPVSLLSVTEYLKYAGKIGKEGGDFWTRTPRSNNAEQSYATSFARAKMEYKTSKTTGRNVRPVFYLKSSFFRDVKLDTDDIGENVADAMLDALEESDKDLPYSEKELKELFGTISLESQSVSGYAIIGETLTAEGKREKPSVKNLKITWEKSRDKIDWKTIDGAFGPEYEIRESDEGHYIRAVFEPEFNSKIFRYGDISYAEMTETVYTNEEINRIVSSVASATDTDRLREDFEEYYPLFKLEYTESKFPDSAAEIFISEAKNGGYDNIEAIKLLYSDALKLYAFNNASATDINAEPEKHLIGDIAEFFDLSVTAQKLEVIDFLKEFTSKEAAAGTLDVTSFKEKVKNAVLLERFNCVERGEVLALISEYSAVLGIKDEISALSGYQFEIMGSYVAGIDFGMENTDKLITAIQKGLEEAKNSKEPDGLTEGKTESYGNDGFIPPVLNKPEPSKSEISNIFSDLESVSWAVSAIDSLARDGILSGDGNGNFLPDKTVTRDEFVKMIVAAFDIEKSDTKISFADVDENLWSAEYIAAAINAGIINGIDENHFGSGMNITRQDVAVIAERVMKHMGIEIKVSSLNYSDSNTISEYAIHAVSKMTYAKIMNGLDGNIFAPLGNTTRAQAAVVIYNLLNYYKKVTNADTSDGEIIMRSTNDKYDLVYQLGILKHEYTQDSKISRGELAAIITAFSQFELSTSESGFEDVTAKHQYSKEIEAVTRNNIMAPVTEKLFMPDETATYAEAYDAIVSATGYKEFPGGLYEVMKALGKEPVNAQKGSALTDEMIKKMIFAALGIPLLDFTDANTYVISESTVLNKVFNTYEAKGVVNAVSGVSLGGRLELSDDKIIITVDSEDYLYSDDKNDFSEYLGYRVTYYYKEIDGAYNVIHMVENNIGNDVLKLSFEQIEDAAQDLSSITYEKGRKKETVDISKKADFIYNGKRCYSVTKSDLTPDNGYITLIDSNKDGDYDVVKIEKFDYIMVAQIDTANRSVLDRFTWTTFGLKEDVDAEKIKITKNGRYIKMEYISSGDIIAIAKSRDGELINAYVSDIKISGRVDSISPEDYELEVDGTILKTVRDFNFTGLSMRTSIVVGVDWNGYAVGYFIENSDSNMLLGYMYKISDGEKLSKNKILSILTQNNEYVKLMTSKKLVINDEKVTNQENLASDIPINQLIGYVLDEEGNIKRMYTTEEWSQTDSTKSVPIKVSRDENIPLKLGKAYEGNSPEVIYNNFGMTLEFNYNFPSSAVMFDISFIDDVYAEIDEEKSRVTTVGAKVLASQHSPARMYIYNPDDSRSSSLCVYEHKTSGGNSGYSEGFNSQAFLVSKTAKMYDEQANGYVTALKGYHEGSEVMYKLSEILENEVDVSKIKSGDVLLIWLSDNEITSFRRLFTFNVEDKFVETEEGKTDKGKPARGETDWMCSYGNNKYLGGTYYFTDGKNVSDECFKWDWAQFTIERAYARSDSSLTSTRWASMYGDILRVYKAEGQAYPVVMLRIVGHEIKQAGQAAPEYEDEDFMPFTLDSNSKVYVYNKSEKTIRVLDANSFNITTNSDGSYKKAVITARYGNVRDVIIYED